MKNLIKPLISVFMVFTLVLIFGTIKFLNGYFVYADSLQDVNITIDGEENGSSGRAQLSIFDKAVEKQYKALSRKLGGKYYFNNSSNDTILIKKTYYLDGQTVTVNITQTNGKKISGNYKFDKLVEGKKYIDNVKITAINGELIGGELVFKGSELGNSKSGINVLSTQ